MLVDFHNHVMPGVDDGASSDEEAGEALRAFLAQNARQIVATPHVDGSLTLRPELLEVRLTELDAGWERLQRIGAERAPELQLFRGAEVMLDTPSPDLGDLRLRLAGTHFVLCEYPFMTVPPNSAGVLRAMLDSGVKPIIAHPERYAGVNTDCALPMRWRQAGALLQINAGSLTGRYGPHARDNAFALLENGMADFLCSDFHARGRPSTSHAGRILAEMQGEEHFQLLTMINPKRMLDDQAPVPVPPLRVKRTVAERLRRWLR